MPVNLIIRNPLDWDALAIARNANGANRRELSDYVRFLKAQAVWNDLGFFRDFANAKSLNHSFGPNIAFTRASIATYFDSGGTLRTAAAGEPRIDHDPAAAGIPSLGLLIEEARTNSIRNAQGGGASAGVGPTHWVTTVTTNNVTRTIVGSGTENGLTYLEIQYAGTPTSNGGFTVAFDSPSQVVAADGQTWTTSAFCKLQAGSLAGITAVQVGVDGRSAAGAELSPAQRTMTTFTPTGAALATQRVSVTRTMAAGAERAFPFILVNYTGGVAMDITLRIAAPQLEQGAFPTSYIPTTSAAVTRSADSAVVTPISSFYNQAEGTLFASASLPVVVATTSEAYVMAIHAGNTDNTVRIGHSSAASKAYQFNVRNAASNIVFITRTTPTVVANTALNQCAAYATNNSSLATSTGATDDTDCAIPTGINAMAIGRGDVTSIQFLNGHIRKIAYWPRRLSNALLETLTT